MKSTHHSPDISWHLVSNNVMQPFISLRMHFLLFFLFPFLAKVKYNQNQTKIRFDTIFRLETVFRTIYSRRKGYSYRKHLCTALHIPVNALFIAFFTTIFGKSNTIRMKLKLTTEFRLETV